MLILKEILVVFNIVGRILQMLKLHGIATNVVSSKTNKEYFNLSIFQKT